MGINTITAIIAIGFLLVVAWGFIPLFAYRYGSWVSWIVGGVVAIVVTSALRLLYWDVTRFVVGEDTWFIVRDALGGGQFSTLFNIALICACIALLNGRLLLIPAHDRHRWRWWNAWWHPREQCRIPWRKRK